MTTEETWTIQKTLSWMEGYLERKGDESPRLSAQWLLGDVTGLSRVELYAYFDRPLTPEELDLLRTHVTRRGEGEPLQYITGEVGFRHVAIKVRSGVLIPRPETEVLVSEALALLPVDKSSYYLDLDEENEDAAELLEGGAGLDDKEISKITKEQELLRDFLVADIGTGSGCIACSIAHEHPSAQVVATDISPDALMLARENVAALGLEEKVQVIESDLGAAVSTDLMGSFDLIVSNPPYIPTEVLAAIPTEVSEFEPTLALDGGEDGLVVFRDLAPWAFRALNETGALVVELHETCLDQAAEISRSAGFFDTQIKEDLTGRPRILVAFKSV